MGKISKILPSLIAVVLAVGLLIWTHRPVVVVEADWAAVQAEARDGGYRLIDADELADWLENDPDAFLLVDTRQDWEYRTGHIQGAVNFPLEPGWWPRFWRKGDLADLLGPDANRTVVFY